MAKTLNDLHLYRRTNDATRVDPFVVNGKTAGIHITVQGSDYYYSMMCVYGVLALAIMAAAAAKPRTDRVFFYTTAAINVTACIAYYALGSNLGWTPIDVEWHRPLGSKVAGVNRQIFYVRYIDWFITTSLILLDLLFTSGLPWPTIIYTIFLDWVMIVCGLVGALVRTRFKWGFYAFGCAAMFAIMWELAFEGRKHAKNLGSDVYKVYLGCTMWTLLIWVCYPVAWGCSEGGNLITPDGEAVFYGVLDFCSKAIFSVAYIAGHWNIDPGRMGLKIRDYDSEPNYFGSKNAADAERKQEHDRQHGGGVTNEDNN